MHACALCAAADAASVACTQIFNLSRKMSPKEVDAAAQSAATARHDKKAFSDAESALLDQLVKAVKSTTQQKALDAWRRIYIELYPDGPTAPGVDFDNMRLQRRGLRRGADCDAMFVVMRTR
jgi:hypothetical protein